MRWWFALLVLAAAICLSPPSWAQDTEGEEDGEDGEESILASDADAESLAMEAMNVIDEHCADVAGSKTALAAKSMGAVSDV